MPYTSHHGPFMWMSTAKTSALHQTAGSLEIARQRIAFLPPIGFSLSIPLKW
jgi:hypothetical protein